MKTSAIIGCGVLMALGLGLNAAPVDLSAPPNSLGAANAHGYVQIWQEIAEVDFGDGLKLPLRIRFSSQPQKPSTSPPIGLGFWCPLTHATAYLKREKMLRCELLCGKVMYLRRDKKDYTHFYSMNKQWTGVVDSKKNRITLTRPSDGWELRYEDGLLNQMKTDTGRLLIWVRNGNMVTEIREEGSASTPLKLAIGSGETADGIYVNGKLYSFKLGRRPRVEEHAGRKVVAGFDPTLAVWTWPDGKQMSFQFEVNEELQPNMKFTNREGAEATYVWDALTSKIVSVNDASGQWDYTVGTVTDAIDLPRLERTNAKGEVEFRDVNMQKGITEQKTLRRGHTITEVFLSTGPLYGKVRQVEKVEDGVKRMIYQAGYSETGQLLRKVGAEGFTTIFQYGKNGKLAGKNIRPPTDKAALDALKNQEGILLQAVTDAISRTAKGDALQRLGFFYIHEMGDPAKAMALLPQMSNPQQIFNIKWHAIAGNRSLLDSQKANQFAGLLKEYPEKRDLLEILINGRRREAKLLNASHKQN